MGLVHNPNLLYYFDIDSVEIMLSKPFKRPFSLIRYFYEILSAFLINLVFSNSFFNDVANRPRMILAIYIDFVLRLLNLLQS